MLDILTRCRGRPLSVANPASQSRTTRLLVLSGHTCASVTGGDRAQGSTRPGRGSGGWMEDSETVQRLYQQADGATTLGGGGGRIMTRSRVFLYSRRMQSSDLDLKRKAPQDHKALQGNLFHYWGGWI